MADDFAARYAGLLTGSYDCVDRIVLNAYYPLGSSSGGFRTWWRRLIGGSDAEGDAVLDNTHLMRLAGRFARRVRAWAADNAVPVIDCTAGERKHLIAEEYLRTHSVGPGVFLILVARAPAMVWDVRRSADGTVIGGLARPRKPAPALPTPRPRISAASCSGWSPRPVWQAATRRWSCARRRASIRTWCAAGSVRQGPEA